MAYNTLKGTGAVRVGNWQEELVLEQTTGIRFAPNPKDRSTQLLTQARVIDHTDRMIIKDYISNTGQTVQDPRRHKDYIPPAKAAPRKLMLEQKWKEQVDAETKDSANARESDRMQPQFTTLNRSSYAKEGFSESLVVNNPKHRIQTNSKNYSVEPAQTYYLHCIQKGKGSVNFPVSYINNTVNPFRKALAYSADIRDPFLRRAETNENPKPLPKVKDYRALRSLRDRIVHNSNNVSLNDIIILIWTYEEDETGMIRLDVLVDVLSNSELGVTPTKAEVDALVTALVFSPNLEKECYVSIIEFINVLRGSLTVHQQEIISLVFDRLDSVGKGYVGKEDVERLYNYEACKTPLTVPSSSTVRETKNRGFRPGAVSSGTVDHASRYVMDTVDQIMENLQITGPNAKGSAELFDFVEYYWNISAVIDGNEVVFEKLMRKQWDVDL
jgi:Ca2+-binding EF-hand superfamily protein